MFIELTDLWTGQAHFINHKNIHSLVPDVFSRGCDLAQPREAGTCVRFSDDYEMLIVLECPAEVLDKINKAEFDYQRLLTAASLAEESAYNKRAFQAEEEARLGTLRDKIKSKYESYKV